jgi:hypothetical protein
VVLQLFNVPGPGTYALGVGPQMVGGAGTVARAPSNVWATPLSGAAGTLTITVLTDVRISGSFSFTATPPEGGTGSVTVTQGEFDLPVVQLSPPGDVPENAGSTVSGSMGGSPFNASSAAIALTGGQNPTLTMVASTTDRGLAFGISRMTGPGTYALSSETPVRSIQATQMVGSGFPTWNSQIGGSGSVTVTSVSAARIQGTFTATLGPLAGGATGTLEVSGSFDVGRP